ncbi:MAG TPA: hypothetical protein VLU92_03120, partial [Candidatus Dormibacteraeota bacterium]|nr:hypothetical protein [Candidatus Dormibacteraeota bacterium]
MVKRPRLFVTLLAVVALAVGLSPWSTASAASQIGGTVPLSGTGSPTAGDAPASGSGDTTTAEFAGQMDTAAGPAPYSGTITGRSNSRGSAVGPTVSGAQKAKSNPTVTASFDGLNLYQQRYARGGNQFTVEPPDQGLCAGNGYVVEAVNDVFNVFDASGKSLLPDNTATNIVAGFPRDVNHAVDLNSFYGYAPAINRTTKVRAQNVTDPSCLYDAATQRFFLVVLTLETRPNGSLTHVNHLDIAVSRTPDPTGLWNIYKVDVT